jgi:uncharacterized protein (TIGR00251 family)
LLIRLQSPPVEGAANSELIRLIAATFGVAARDVSIIAGERGKLKRIAILGVHEAEARCVFASLGIDPEIIRTS